MAEIIGVGVSHYPGPMVPDAYMAGFLRRTLASARVPENMKDPKSWPAPMQAEWANDGGEKAAGQHRARFVEAFSKVRAEIQNFNPDFILMWGDDQYENFLEDGIPPFCIYVFDQAECRPLIGTERWSKTPQNFWGENPTKVFPIKGHVTGARFLIRRLMEEDIDVSYAYAFRSARGLAHSFGQTMLYLDYERRGYDFKIVPFHVNCYGSHVISSRGGGAHLERENDGDVDPPPPSPKRCFDVGRKVARILQESPWRVVLMASSSWSHAFLNAKSYWLYPDMEADRRRFEELKEAKYDEWRMLNLAEIENAGQNEILNWVCLAGAMSELRMRTEIIDYIETYVFNSNKCFAVFRR
jgi:Catalytic LigB subunit of aromatic ring-opening dioxygenase